MYALVILGALVGYYDTLPQCKEAAGKSVIGVRNAIDLLPIAYWSCVYVQHIRENKGG